MHPHVVVTGANGYIGRHVVRALASGGAKVSAVVRSLEGNAFFESIEASDNVSVVVADVLEPSIAMDELLSSADSLVHFAWQDGFVLASPAHMSSVSSHYKFLTHAAELGIKKIAVAGTMHEIGYWEGAIDDDTPSRPQSLYGIAKVALRDALLARFAGSDVVVQWLRMFYIVGDDRRSNSVFGKIVTAVDDGKVTFPFTSGRNEYDFIDLAVVSDQIAAVVLGHDESGVINCCSGVPQRLGDRVQQFINDESLPITLEFGAFPDRPFDSPGVWGDSSKISAIMAASHTTQTATQTHE
jgi:dTDP-6-deoxy-L-talose 4-dehydrogenase (NAD+)